MCRPVTVVVTGGAGFIGSNLVDALVARGERVVVVDDLSTGRRANLAGSPAELREVDITDAPALASVLDEVRPDRVFHLAAQIDVRRSVADPAFDARVNVEGTINVLTAARAAGAPRVVFASTGGALYGDAHTIPTPEDAPIAPLAPYGQAKFAAEGYLALDNRLHGLSTICLRFANVYGPRQDPLGEAGVVAIFCHHRLTGGRPTVYGDGTQTRDFVYVGDVVDALLAAGDSDVTGAFNVGTGTETSVLELAAAFGDGDFVPELAPARPGEVQRSCLDCTKIAEALGWRAKTPLVEGLELTLAAIRAG
jgi:UDP-glucose 4-epimerase